MANYRFGKLFFLKHVVVVIMRPSLIAGNVTHCICQSELITQEWKATESSNLMNTAHVTCDVMSRSKLEVRVTRCHQAEIRNAPYTDQRMGVIFIILQVQPHTVSATRVIHMSSCFTLICRIIQFLSIRKSASVEL